MSDLFDDDSVDSSIELVVGEGLVTFTFQDPDGSAEYTFTLAPSSVYAIWKGLTLAVQAFEAAGYDMPDTE